MTGLAPSPEAFGKFVLVFAMTNYAAQSMGYLASSFSANPIVGLSIRESQSLTPSAPTPCPLTLLPPNAPSLPPSNNPTPH